MMAYFFYRSSELQNKSEKYDCSEMDGLIIYGDVLILLEVKAGSLATTSPVLEYSSSNPWVMRGFPGKISNLTWS
jgi:hypothetical protein